MKAHASSGLAKRLGLHPPFQAMDLNQLDDEKQLDNAGITRDRKRKCSSTATSYLEPAVIDDPIEARTNMRNGDTIRYQESYNVGYEDKIDTSSSTSASSLSSPSPVQPAVKTYERRARRKTKDDRYELKEDKKVRKERAKGKKTAKKEASGKKRKRSKKSGVALSHGFTAKNVASNRLTV